MTPNERTFQAQNLFADWHKLPLNWGVWDCARMAGDMAARITGTNPIADWPEYKSEQQAVKSLRKMGFKSLQDAVSSFATPLEGPLFAMAGDIVAIKADKKIMPALGVMLGPDAIICFYSDLDEKGEKIPNTSRARRLDMQFAEYAWRIG